MARKAFRGNGRRSQRRETAWFSISPIAAVVTTGGGTLMATLNAAADALRPFTIVRTHLEILFTSDQSIAAETFGAAIGFAVVSDQASAIGVTAIPTPITDLGSDLFFVHKVLWGDFLFKDATGIQGNAGQIYSVDSKAMRKINEDQDLVIVTESMGSVLGDGSVVSICGRFLVKLH